MKDIERRVWLVTLAALLLFAIYETIKTVLFPSLSIVSSHIITVVVVVVMTFLVSRYALGRYSQALREVQRQTAITEETNRLMAGVLATMREGVVIVNSQFGIALYNEAAARIFKLRETDIAKPATLSGQGSPQVAARGEAHELREHVTIQTQSVNGDSNNSARKYRLTDATRDPAINSAFRRALEEKIPVELRVDMADREHRSFQLNVAPLRGDLAVGVFFDITQLERLERVRREFFANLSHELRTPLTAILAYSETLLTGAIDDPEHNTRFLDTLYKHATRMNELISDISDLSAIESGQIELALKPVNLRRAVADVVMLLESRRADTKVSITASVPTHLRVQADRTRLEQIPYNLVDNAVKFNRPKARFTSPAKRARAARSSAFRTQVWASRHWICRASSNGFIAETNLARAKQKARGLAWPSSSIWCRRTVVRFLYRANSAVGRNSLSRYRSRWKKRIRLKAQKPSCLR